MARRRKKPLVIKPDTATLLPLDDYEKIVVSFSGGKDSTACFLHALEAGVPIEKIELWHQCVDGAPEGRPGATNHFFDWPVTEAYVEAFAAAFGVRLLYQWKNGGIIGEMMKHDGRTSSSGFELPGGRTVTVGGTRGKIGTRLMFPAPTADLGVRWCTPYAKIDPDAKVYANDPRFKRGCTVCELTGERREESANRATYANVEPHKAATRVRRIEHWRPVIDWPEEEVWDILARWNVNPHPCYHLGWSRCSCISCIFGDPRDWASVRLIDSELFRTIEELEDTFGRTIRMDGLPVGQWADRECERGRGPYFDFDADRALVKLAMGRHYDPADIFVKGKWQRPRGAYGHSGGPV